jgi:long-chain acyl-CoA synthetase
MSGDALLLTGATGFVGTELLVRELARGGDRHVFALIRADSDEHAAQRLRATIAGALGTAAPYADRVTAIAGDLTRPRLGLRPDRARALAGAVGEIVHGAASVSFELALDRSREVNVQGTRRMLEFALRAERLGGLRRMTYISTAYVAGEHRGLFGEDEPGAGGRFRNPYEQSKFEAETLVRAHRDRLPITVVRPSIVVGDSAGGWTASFNVLYWPLRALARGAYPILPARRSAPVDVVPVDYVADAIGALARLPGAEGGTFHLTASARASSIGELLDLAVARLGCRRPPLVSPGAYRHVVHPLAVRTASARRRRFLRATEAYLPYFAMRVRYDDAHARAALGPALAPPPLHAYFDRLVDYALLADWGRHPLTRAAASRQPAQATPLVAV